MNCQAGQSEFSGLPKWVPDAARHYLAHTEKGLSIRALARASDCHPSTVLRQVRRFEGRRDDPLIDAALKALSSLEMQTDDTTRETRPMNISIRNGKNPVQPPLTQTRIDQEAKRILHRLCETGAVLAVARDLETAVVVRTTDTGEQLRTASVDREIAQAMALKDWITCPVPETRITRYFITNTGRSALRRLTAEDENRASGFSDRRAKKDGDAAWDLVAMDAMQDGQSRYQVTESPLVGLARRRDRNGEPFLKRELVAVGERLREDFELAAVGIETVEDCEAFLALTQTPPAGASDGARAALTRLRDALADLGPGLGDVALRCCCLLEGMEQTEKKMGWSARSGKIVLRISLQRLGQHYLEVNGKYGPMIG